MPRRVYANLRDFFNDTSSPSATDTAAKLRISIAYMSQIKWGTRQPPLDLALKISALCSVPLESLLMPEREKEKAS